MYKTEEYDERKLLNEAKKYDKSWEKIKKELIDFIFLCNFITKEDSYESYFFSGGSSQTYYTYSKRKLFELILEDLKEELKKEL